MGTPKQENHLGELAIDEVILKLTFKKSNRKFWHAFMCLGIRRSSDSAELRNETSLFVK
jgi:hypothetical protein